MTNKITFCLTRAYKELGYFIVQDHLLLLLTFLDAVYCVVSCSVRPDLSSGQRSGQLTIVLQSLALIQNSEESRAGSVESKSPCHFFGNCISVNLNIHSLNKSISQIQMSEEEAVVETEGANDPAPASSGSTNVLVTDAFPGIVKLDDGLWKSEGAPNWRRVPGFPIYATGQPSKADIDKCVEQAVKKYDEQKHVLWVNVRQEPVIYINGAPFSVRSSDDVAGHLVFNEAFEMNNIENAMASELKKSQTGEFTYFKDQVGEKAVEKIPPAVPAKGRADNVVTVSELFGTVAKKETKLEYKRIPLNLNCAAREDTFDQVVRLLKAHGSAVPVIFNCQGGYVRSSAAAVMAGIIKEAQLEAEFKKMEGEECVIVSLQC